MPPLRANNDNIEESETDRRSDHLPGSNRNLLLIGAVLKGSHKQLPAGTEKRYEKTSDDKSSVVTRSVQDGSQKSPSVDD